MELKRLIYFFVLGCKNLNKIHQFFQNINVKMSVVDDSSQSKTNDLIKEDSKLPQGNSSADMPLSQNNAKQTDSEQLTEASSAPHWKVTMPTVQTTPTLLPTSYQNTALTDSSITNNPTLQTSSTDPTLANHYQVPLHSIHSTHSTQPAHPDESFHNTSNQTQKNSHDLQRQKSSIPLISDTFGDVNDANDDDAIRKDVVKNILTPWYYTEIRHNLTWRKSWSNGGHFFDVGHKLIFIASAALSFASATYKNPTLAFAAGTAGVIATGSMTFSNFCFKKAREKTKALNVILDRINIYSLPDIVAEPDEDTSASNTASRNPMANSAKNKIA